MRLLLRQQAQWCYEMAKHRYHIWIVFLLFQLNESEWETLSPIWQTYFRFSLDQINKYSFWLNTLEPLTLAVGFWFDASDRSFIQWLTASQFAFWSDYFSFSLNVTFNSIWLVAVFLVQMYRTIFAFDFCAVSHFFFQFPLLPLCASINNANQISIEYANQKLFFLLTS